MSKRSAETQLTKDQMSGSFNFSAGGSGGPDDSMEPSKMASADTLAGRKIAPLKRRGVGRGAGARSGASSANLPNVFAGVGTGVLFGTGANGAPSPSPAPAPSFGSGFSGAPTPPISTSFGNGTSSGFTFGQPQQEQAKPNPFANLAPQAPAPTNGTSARLFGNGSGSFGSTTTAPATNGMFGNANGSTATASTAPGFGGFSTTTNNDKPAASGFTFGSSNNTVSSAPATGGMFGNNASTAATPFTFGAAPASKEAPKPAATGFLFGQTSTAPAPEAPKPALSGFSFGQTSTAPAPEASKPASTGFLFGQTSTAPAPEAPKPAAPSFSFNNPSFGAPAAAAAGFGSGLATDATDGKPPAFTFGKPAESKPADPSGGSLFGGPNAAAPAPMLSGFTFGPAKEAPAAAAPTSFFGKPMEPSKPLFGFAEKDEAPKSFFGAPTTEKKDEQPAPMFGFGGGNNATKKDEPQKPLFSMTAMFGSAPAEKKEEPKSMFGNAGGFSFGAAKPVEKPAEKPAAKLDFSNPMFGPKPAGMKSAAPLKPISFPAAPFGPLPSATTTTTTTAAAAAAAAAPATASTSVSTFSAPPANAVSSVRMRSPPLSADSQKWSVNQLTDYYNLFALRSLNHFFKEELSKQDILADLTPLCDAYTAEVQKIKWLMEKNQRYKFGEAALGNGAPGKRASEDNGAGGGGGKRWHGEEPKVMFASPKSSSSQALASVLGGGSSSSKFAYEPPKADRQSPKAASIFDNPSPTPANTTWVNPFKKADTSNLPDDPEPNQDDEPAPKTGGLFGRISPPKDKPFKASSSIFSAGGDQTWSPDKGVKFSSAPPASTGLFSSGITNGGGLFGAGTTTTAAAANGGSSSSSIGFFGSKPVSAASTATTTSAPTSAEASEAESANANDSEPPDVLPPAKPEKDLSLQGPGEEDEDSKFQTRSIVYDMAARPVAKLGVGSLRVLKNRNNGKARIIVRSDLGKVLLNVALSKGAKYTLQDKVCLRVPEFLESGKIRTWGCKVSKEDGLADKFKTAVEEAIGA